MSLEPERTHWVVNASTEIFAKKNDFWNEERINHLKRMWDEGLSSTQIGKEIGCSRNAVIGKAFRLQLPARKPRIWPEGTESLPRPRKVRMKMKFKSVGPHAPSGPPQAPQELSVSTPAPKSSRSVGIEGLQEHHCRYIVSPDGEEVRYCGAQKASGSYCGYHARMCYHFPQR